VGAGRSGPIERKGKLPGQMLGKSPWLQSVLIDGGELGDVVEVEIVAAGTSNGRNWAVGGLAASAKPPAKADVTSTNLLNDLLAPK